jgi:hypothetical protein
LDGGFIVNFAAAVRWTLNLYTGELSLQRNVQRGKNAYFLRLTWGA